MAFVRFKKQDLLGILIICLLLIIPAYLLVILKNQPATPIVSPLVSDDISFATSIPLPSLSLEQIFDQWVNTAFQETTTLLLTGDIIPARSVNRIMRQRNNFHYPFEKTASFLSAADITLVNLETPLIDNCSTTDQGTVFCGDPLFVKGLVFAGIDVVNLANNHASNHGAVGVNRTVTLLLQNGIKPIGLGSAEYLNHKGVIFAFLGYNGVFPFHLSLATIDRDAIVADIGMARQIADVVVVSFHWGKEYTRQPQSAPGIAPDDPIGIARFTIDAGADVVVGNHPHWYQGIEIYKGKLILYALGNFIFDQFWSEETKKGFMAKIYFVKDKIVDVELLPIYTEGIQPTLAVGQIRQEILDNIYHASVEIMKGRNVVGYKP